MWRLLHRFYRPQRSCGKVIFSEACVKNSVHMGGGGRLPQWMLGYTTPHPLGRHRPGRQPPGQTPPGQTATSADGTHPTGMHSCFKWVERVPLVFFTHDITKCQKKKIKGAADKHGLKTLRANKAYDTQINKVSPRVGVAPPLVQ